ncbi:MarR family winged helix-turn-helix transcriptional regulator [Halanaerobium congolense]|jgi:DNA-binding MarR family transcriptional regulator|uniref:MarR family transcriptional regulator n=1 Tax=Halanaerobium congolense TaxID=54121 RepID=A0A1M7M582_9FIRM|nr:MarR family transcriptional regulator [Halanaerobium congolense]PXV61144.1 MarR family transcriptional regulator [Halanaerobium congolense]TDP26736.1 MarR family transcriptional regulator [Halanaerobium congolense]TDS25972.1 MarR family transcriptional regulator [Halanaerobium congolense]SDH57471.1 DNA-binding transcriptional regulator, MarR family [Halanaerobium congolense]SHM85760.1 DNA-binding transcriptional regulator, MarR family [Halanaerobium congolense]
MNLNQEIMNLNKETRDIDNLIRDINKYLVQFTKRNLKKNGLTMPRFKVLWNIKKNQPVNMSFLHKKMYMANSTLTVIVDKLVDEKFVKRYRSPEDRRVVLLELTESGDKLLCKMIYVRQSFLEKALIDLDLQEQDEVIKSISSVCNNLEGLLKKGDDVDECR